MQSSVFANIYSGSMSDGRQKSMPTESVGGMKTIEALGALKLMSGGSASLAAVDDLHQATGQDMNVVVGQKHNATVGGDMQERIEGGAPQHRCEGAAPVVTEELDWVGID